MKAYENFKDTGNPKIDEQINTLIEDWGIEKNQDYFRQMLGTLYRLAQDDPFTKDVKQISIALKEMRYANAIFKPYDGVRKISVFGSARTQPEQPEYKTAEAFAHSMMESGFMAITGGGDGIMGAAQAGAGREKSFALNIELPFEQEANKTIEGDKKLLTFKYFFTRKLNLVKHSSAIALMPGGFGTMDEGFETITLMQTGKAPIIPVIMLDAPGGNYWKTFTQYLREHLLRDGMVSPNDFNLFKVTDDIEVARKEILNFYYNFHSYRYIGDNCVIRMKREIPPAALARVQEDFTDILTATIDGLQVCSALPEEKNEPEIADLPRLCVKFNMRSYGRLRQLIDRINMF